MAFAATPEAFILLDTHGLVMDINPAAEKLLQYRSQEVLGHPIPQWIVGWDTNFLKKTQETQSLKLLLCRKDKVRLSTVARLTPIKADNQVYFCLSLSSDINTVYHPSHWETIINASPECIKMVSQEGDLIFINPMGRAMLEYDEGTLPGQKVYEFVAPEDRATWIENHLRVCQGESLTWQYDIIGLRGTRRTLETHAVPVDLADGAPNAYCHLAVTQDITSRRQTEQALKESEARFRSLADYAPVMIWMMDPQGNRTYINQAVQLFIGQKMPDVVPLSEWRTYIHPDDEAAAFEAVTSALKNPRHFELEFRVRQPDNQYRWILSKAVPRYHQDGEFLGYVGTSLDINERKEMRQVLENLVSERTEQLQLLNKELESFSYSISHDLRTPLRAIDGFSHILLKNYACNLDEQGKHYLDRIQQGAKRMSLLIEGLLDLSRVSREPLIKINTDLGDMARDILTTLQAQDPDRQVSIQVADELMAYADPNLMRAVIDNLVSNAWKFTATDRPATIEIGQCLIQERNVYYIRDNGAGFDMAYAHKLFSPFQRLHAVTDFPGSGIGLATVQRIIRRHGGEIWVDAEPNQGATFYFTLGEDNNTNGSVV